MIYSGKLDLSRKVTLVVGENKVGKTTMVKQQLKDIKEKLIFIQYPENSLFPPNIVKKCVDIVNNEVIGNGYKAIIETNSTHFVNHIRYMVFAKKLLPDDVMINFFSSYQDEEHRVFIQNIGINEKSMYVDLSSNQVITFPDGFFNTGLDELIEMT